MSLVVDAVAAESLRSTLDVAIKADLEPFYHVVYWVIVVVNVAAQTEDLLFGHFLRLLRQLLVLKGAHKLD